MKPERKYVLYRQWDTARVFYVTDLPGHGGVDWGYSERPSDAISVSRYWMARFKMDCARVNQHGLCYEVSA